MSSSEALELEHLAAPAELMRAWDHVRRRSPAAGIDGITVPAFAEGLQGRLDELSLSIATGEWRPKPARRVRLAEDPDRDIAISTVADRIVQRALANLLTPRCALGQGVHGYRRGRSVATALRAFEEAAHTRRWIARTDIRKFFDSIDRARLGDRLASLGLGRRLRRLVDRLLGAGAIQGAALFDSGLGVTQGSALSPLLSNLYLTPVDEAMEAGPCVCIRYADDLALLGLQERDALAGLERLAHELSDLGLELNPRKTRRSHLGAGIEFLGARFDAQGRGLGRAAHRALHATADALTQPQPLADLLADWTLWQGELRAADLTSIASLAGLALSADAARLPELAARRLELGSEAAAAIHAALAERWADSDDAQAQEALLLDAHLALRGGVAPGLPLDEASAAALAVDPASAVPALAAAGLGHWAEAARRFGARVRPGEAPHFTPEAVAALARKLDGWEGEHALEIEARPRHYRFERVDKPLDDDALEAHLVGKARRGLYASRGDGTLRLATVEIGLRRTAILPRPGETDGRQRGQDLRALVEDHARAWLAHAGRLEVPLQVEARAPHQLRLWLFFDAPVQLRHAFALLARLEHDVGRPAKELSVRRSPARQSLRKLPGPLVPLPLGVDPRSGHRAQWLEGWRPSARPVAALLAAPSMSVAQVHALVMTGPLTASAPRPEALDVPAPVNDVLTGCAVLRAFARKAERIGHLEGEERATLRETLGHLPRPIALQGLGEILEPLGLGPRPLERRLDKLTPNPISCAAIRRRHPTVCLEFGCDCRFEGIGRGVYPTPVLHTLRPHQIPVFKRARNKGKRAPVKSDAPASAAKSNPEVPQAEPRSTEGSKPTAPVAFEPTAPVAPEVSAPATAATPAPGEQEARFERALKRVSNARSQIENAQRGLRRASAELANLFDREGVDRVRLSQGWLVRLPEDPPRFIIEV